VIKEQERERYEIFAGKSDAPKQRPFARFSGREAIWTNPEISNNILALG
jgi:hypothetical protein